MKRSHQLSLAVALALGLAACGKQEEPKKAATAPAAPAGVTVHHRPRRPAHGARSPPRQDDENGVALAVATGERQEDHHRRQARHVQDDERGRPGPIRRSARRWRRSWWTPRSPAVIGHPQLRRLDTGLRDLQQGGNPMISGSATNPALTERGMKTVFRTVGRDDQQGPAIASYIAAQLKAKKGRDHRRQDRVRRRHRQRGREGRSRARR